MGRGGFVKSSMQRQQMASTAAPPLALAFVRSSCPPVSGPRSCRGNDPFTEATTSSHTQTRLLEQSLEQQGFLSWGKLEQKRPGTERTARCSSAFIRLTGCVTSGKLLHFSGLSHLEHGIDWRQGRTCMLAGAPLGSRNLRYHYW